MQYFYSRICSVIGRNMQYYCEGFCVCVCEIDVICSFISNGNCRLMLTWTFELVPHYYQTAPLTPTVSDLADMTAV